MSLSRTMSGLVMLGLLMGAGVISTSASAQESVFVGKVDGAVKPYREKLGSACGMKDVTPVWEGKLGVDPEAGGTRSGGAIGRCQAGLDAVVGACSNAAVKKMFEKVKAAVCKKGKGGLVYKYGGNKIWIMFDPTQTSGDIAAEKSALEKKIVTDVDK